jgi:large subunit ribosomal protein L15
MLHTLKPYAGSRKKKKRIARGSSAGGGTTGGRGQKGQQSRTGKGRRLGFEGGQTPLIRRQPKLGGFKNPNRIDFEIINIETLEAALDAGTYDVAALMSARIVRTKRPVKLLGKGSVTKKFDVSVHAASKPAADAIKKAGGSVTIVRP